MAYRLTDHSEIPDFVSDFSSSLTVEANGGGTETTTKEALACDTNFCLRYQSSALSFKLPTAVDNTANLYQFHSSIRERLTKCTENNKYRNNELQLNLWPLITTGHSVSVIGPENSGKTTAYVLYLMNRFRLSGYLQAGVTADQMSAKASPLFQPQRICGSKIYAIVLTDSMRSVIRIGSEFIKWIRILIPQPKIEAEVEKKNENAEKEDEGSFDKAAAHRRRQAQRNQYSIRVNLLHEKSSMVDYFDVLNGCAVLVSTAAALTKLIRLHLIPINDNQVLIIDNADEFINSSSKDVVDLFEMTGSPRYDFYSNRQTMLFGQCLSANMSKYFFEVQHKPTLVVSSFYDATIIFKQATAKIELCLGDSAEEAAVRVINSELLFSERVPIELRGVAIIGAVICKNYSQIESLKAHLDSSKCIDSERLRLFVLKESATAAELNRLSVDLLTTDHHMIKLVLLTTEDIFTFAPYFRKFNCLLHLDQRFDQYRDLPTALNYRYLIAYDLFIGASGHSADAEEKFQIEQLGRLKENFSSGVGRHHILNYFFLSPSGHSSVQEECFKQTVVDLLEYCGHLDKTTATFISQNIADYIQMNIECNICPQFAAFAKCKARDKGLKCWRGRHTLTRQLDSISPVKKISPNTQIWFNITHVEEPNQFFIHLLGYRSEEQATGDWVTTEHRQEMARLRKILEKYSGRPNKKRRVISPLTIGHVYLMHNIDDLYRVQLKRIHPLNGTEDLPIWLHAGRSMSLTDEQLTFFKLTVTVFALDTGRTITTKAFNLIALDPTDTPAIVDIPPLAYRAVLPEVVPLEGAYSWHSMFNSKLGALCTDSFLLQMDGAKEENTITGWILAVSLPPSEDSTTTTTTTLWLHQVFMAKMLHFVGVYNYTNLAEDMIRRGLAVANDRTFPGCDYKAHARVSAIWRANTMRKESQKVEQKLPDFQDNESSDEDEAYCDTYYKVTNNFDNNDEKDEHKVDTGELVDTDSSDDDEEGLLATDVDYDHLKNDNGIIVDFDRQMLYVDLNFGDV